MGIVKFFQDPDGKPSATRLAFLLWALGALVVWLFACFESKDGVKMLPIDSTVSIFLGVLMTGKVIQSIGEQNAQSTITSAQSTQTITRKNPNVSEEDDKK